MGRYALLIGVSKFDDPKLGKLNAPQSDVEALAALLKDPERGAFDDVATCIDDDLQTIKDKLGQLLLMNRRADDTVLLYYSGHGILTKGRKLFLATGQSSFDLPQMWSVSASDLRENYLETSRALTQVVILDCCHSGAFGARGGAAVTDDTFGTPEGQYVLTATDALQFAYDDAGTLRQGADEPHLSRFTSWLVDGLKGAAAPNDDRITLDALAGYLETRARVEAAGMTPKLFVHDKSGPLVIAKNPSGRPLSLPDGLPARLGADDWQVRRDAVTELTQLAEQPRLRDLVEQAITDRISSEFDVRVRKPMLALLTRLDTGAERQAQQEASKNETTARESRNSESLRESWNQIPFLGKATVTGIVAAIALGAIGSRLLAPTSAGRAQAAAESGTTGAEFQECEICPVMVAIPPGKFTMGSPSAERGREEYESPEHSVTIARPFAVGKYEVTFAQWDACVADGGCDGYRPADEGAGRGNHPVIYVSWNDAQSYVMWLKAKTGKQYRLLSEAEWEYAARAKTETSYYWGPVANHDMANYGKDDGTAGLAQGSDSWQFISPVGSFPPNPFGLYDMSGNVWEGTADCWHEDYLGAPDDGVAWTTGGDCGQRILRGGSWASAPAFLRSATRGRDPTGTRAYNYGFRVARTF